MGGVRFPCRKADQPHYYAHGLALGGAFSDPARGFDPSNLSQTLGRWLPPPARLCCPASRSAFGIFLNEIDEHLNRCLTGPDQERDRTIFWLYFRQGMSTKEIASLPTIGLSAKGVGSVIERLNCCIREHILGIRSDSDDDRE